MILIPHAILILFLSWAWGVWHASLFVAYSLAVSLVYLALDLRRIEGTPFSKQVDSTRGATLLPLMILGSIAAATAVGLQYILVFRSTAAVIIVTAVLSGAAYFLTRIALVAFEGSIRYHLALLSVEAGPLYKEIDV
jgi:hypothetical protein